MTTYKDEILDLLATTPGLTDREITDRLRGEGVRHQPTRVACAELTRAGKLERRRGSGGRIGNYPTGARPAAGQRAGDLGEDEVKRALVSWLGRRGWASEVAWGGSPGIDVEATRDEDRWIIEAKGSGAYPQMRRNYFETVLGDVLRRMDDPEASYAIALPDMTQYRRLWDRLPALAKKRTRVGVLFVDGAETARHETEDLRRVTTSRCYVPSGGPLAWRDFLADPEKQWRAGYSAKALAHSWEAQDGLPPEVASLIRTVSRYAEEDPELLVALPEWEVPLPGGSQGSHNDVLALIGVGEDLMVAAVEGKVSEPFDKSIADWVRDAGAGRKQRLQYLCDLLGMVFPPPGHLRYQLFHRAVSAIKERRRFRGQSAAMIVHSFSGERSGFDDYEAFVETLGGSAAPNRMTELGLPDGTTLLLGWASGEQAGSEA